MEYIRQLQELESLNRAFQKAFSHAASKETVEDLLACIGEELACSRISIFEARMDGTFDNSYEWCRDSTDRMRELLHALPAELFSKWMPQLRGQEYYRLRDLTPLKELSPELYDLFSSQGIRSLIASCLAFRGQEIGFFLLENPGDDILNDASIIIPGMRYILSSMVYHEHLQRRLEAMGQRDQLTGTGNLSGLKERAERWPGDQPVGICYVEVMGWAGTRSTPALLQTEQALIRCGEILTGKFGESAVFRVAANEFLVLQDAFRIPFDRQMVRLRALLKEHDLLCGLGTLYREAPGAELDSLIRQAHLTAHEESQHLLTAAHEEHALVKNQESWDLSFRRTKADISLHRSDEFFLKAEDFIRRFPGASMLTAVIDLNYFKLFNDIFGREAGNRFLENIAACLVRQSECRESICGYLGGDNFIILLPLDPTGGTGARELAEEIYQELEYPDGFSPAMGVSVSAPGEPLTAMYDHALTALEEIKGSYVENVHFYDPDRYSRERDDKLLLMDMREGIANDEFTFFLQPQVHEQTGKIVGAEALCRWFCRGKMVSPGQFIPTMEKTGTIFEVDSIIWEKVCAWLSGLKERGLPQIPVSVNVSRVDFFFTDIAQHFIDLVQKYDLDPALLGIEITESAFADNTDMLLDAVERLHEAGFQVLMDDFGSGYSSLSMLHSMNLDVLKTDVRFMSQADSNVKAISIVESVVSMAHMIGMIVITEGIETEAQRRNLIAMGENYAQGFLFYRPMPVADFEALLRRPELLGSPFQKGTPDIQNRLHFREMVNNGILSGSLLDNLIGPAAVLKRENGRLSLLQINDQCRALTGIHADSSFSERFLSGNEDFFTKILSQADGHPGEGAVGTLNCFAEGGPASVNARVFMLYTCEDHALYFMTVSDPAVAA